MQLIKQDKPQCLLYAFAMATGIKTHRLLAIIGHDGLEVLWPEACGDKRYRGFHHQEMIDALMILGWSVVMVEAVPNLGYGGQHSLIYTETEMQQRLDVYLQSFSGVLTSDTHAVAWDHNERKCYDPNGYTYSIDSFSVREFFIVTRGNYEDAERIRWTIQRVRTPEAARTWEAGVLGRAFKNG